MESVEQPLLQHVPGPVVALLAGLEHEDDLAGEVVGPIGEQAGGGRQHRRVGVVTAGVHRPVDLGRVVEVGVLRHREGVHVAAEQHRAAGAAGVERGGHRAHPGAGAHVEAEVPDGLEHGPLGAGQVVADLRVAVQVAAQVDGVGLQGPGGIEQLSGHGATLGLGIAAPPGVSGLGTGRNGNRPAMTADSDDTIPERVEGDEFQDPTTDEDEDESVIDRMRGSGAGVEDPEIVGDAHPGVVDAEIGEDEPPQV